MDRRHFIAGSSALALAAPSLPTTVLAAPAVRGDPRFRGLLDAIFADDLIRQAGGCDRLRGSTRVRMRGCGSLLDPRGEKARKAGLAAQPALARRG